jgi:DNA primase
MGRIAEEKIEEIRDRVDIVEVVSGYLPLKRSGVNHQGLCPFHQEKTPSFNVNSARQIFHCFGCGVGGNVFSFVMRMEGLSFPDAVRRLGERVGVEIEQEEASPAELRRRESRQRLLRINDAALAFYHRILLDDAAGAVARRYLRQRGYDGDTVRSFQLGFAPQGWESLARHLAGSFSVEEIRCSGLVREGQQGRGDYDLFRSRLLFPIHDPQGKVVAFGGRVLDDSLPKYINSPETEVYRKSQVLYGLHQARDAMRHSDEALVVEGYFDVLALHRAGFTNAVATCGTALTAEHARLLKRYADKVLLVFDQDAAGRQATFRAMDELLPSGLVVNVVTMPSGEDPDSVLKASGEEGFQDCLKGARPALEVFIEECLGHHDRSVEGRARAAEEVLQRIRRLPGDLERDLYLKRLAELTGLDLGLLQSKARQRDGRRQPPSGAPPSGAAGRTAGRAAPTPQTTRLPTVDEQVQKYLLRLMLVDGGQRARVREEGTDKLFIDDFYRTLAEHLLASEGADGELPGDLFDPSLDEAQQAFLAGLVMQDEAGWADNPERIFADCRRAAGNRLLRQRLREIAALEQAARDAGDEAALLQFLRERTEINQKLKKKL